MNANHPLAQLLSGIVGDASKPSYHRCKNPGCVMRQIILRDGQIKAKAVVGIPGTLTEDKVYMLTGVKGSQSWATVDDEGVRFTGDLGLHKRQDPAQDSPNAFYIGEELLEEYRQSLPEKEDEGHDDDEKPKMSMSDAFDEFFTKPTPVFDGGDVLRVREGFYTGTMAHGRDWKVVATFNPGDDYSETGEITDLTVMIVDPNDGEITFDRVNSKRYELALPADQFQPTSKIKATKVHGEQQ